MDPNLAIVAACAVLLVGLALGAVAWGRSTRSAELDAKDLQLAAAQARYEELEQQLALGASANAIAVAGAQARADAAVAGGDPDVAWRLLTTGDDGGIPNDPGGPAQEQDS